jgi:hypothetical protein
MAVSARTIHRIHSLVPNFLPELSTVLKTV